MRMYGFHVAGPGLSGGFANGVVMDAVVFQVGVIQVGLTNDFVNGLLTPGTVPL
jgi:hypothetical protein